MPFHYDVRAGLAGGNKAEAGIEAPGAVFQEDVQPEGQAGGLGIGADALEQGGAHAGVSEGRQQCDVHEMPYAGGTMQDQPTGALAAGGDDVEGGVRVFLVAGLAGAELQGEEGLAGRGRPAPGVEFLLARAGIEVKKERLVAGLLRTKGDGLGNGWHGGPRRGRGWGFLREKLPAGKRDRKGKSLILCIWRHYG